jgi:hypothetical protein
MKKTIKVFNFLWLLSFLLAGSWAQASTEFRAIVLRAHDLYEGPGEDYGKAGASVEAKEELYVLGSSVGGAWVRVAKENGKAGWIPVTRVEFERVPTTETYEVHERVMRESRRTSFLQLDGGLSSGSLPYGKGVMGTATVSLAPGGLLGVNSDQFEVGGSFGWHLGSEVFGYLETSGNRLSLNEATPKSFWSGSAFIQWMFRGGERGSFMMGPRFGLMFTPYNFDELMHYPITAGLTARYYTAEWYGYFASAQVALETSIYFLYNVGMSIRF